MTKQLFISSVIIACCLIVKISADYTIKLVRPKLLVWMCLEFCDETETDINRNLKEISNHKDAISAVSFERYTLGENCTLIDNHFNPQWNITVVAPEIIAMGLEAWPLLSSFPHPPEFMQWMRQVFKSPDAFIDSCINVAKTYGYKGFNLDWEPTTPDVTAQDGLDYAAFIDYFAKALHREGILLSVDIATWSPIWNYTAINSTSSDAFVSMGTYTSSDSSFTKQLNMMISSFSSPMATSGRIGIGLENVNASTGARLPVDEVLWRFREITNASLVSQQLMQVAIWKLPVPPLWWPIINRYVKGEL